MQKKRPSESAITTPEIALLARTNVIHVVSVQDSTVLLAFNLRLRAVAGELFIDWYDSQHIRTFRVGRILKNTAAEFSFERDDREPHPVYRLSPLTLDSYNREVKGFLLSPPEFETEEALLTALRSAHGSPLGS